MARQPFSSSMSDILDPYGAMRTPVAMPTAYYFLRTVLIAGALAGGLFALYRNDVFLDLAHKAGQEQRYLELEKFLLGSPGWGTPRSMQPVLAGATEAKLDEASAPVTPLAAAPESPLAAARALVPASAPTQELAAQPVAAAAPVPAPAPVATTKSAPAAVNPLAPVSLDSLPLLGARVRPAGNAPVSVASLPTRAPAATPMRTSPAPAARASTGTKTRAIAVSLDDSDSEEPAAPARPAKAKAEPAPAPEPPPAPVASKPEPKGPKTIDPHPHDNPLTAAIRSAVRARPPKDTVPQ